MTPAPDGLCMVGQELYLRQAEYWNNATAQRHKPLGRHWECTAEEVHRILIKHAALCRTCKRMIAQ